MSSDNLSRLLSGLECAGVKHGSRNKTVAEKTGYSTGTVNRILSGNAVLTERFIQAACGTFGIRKEWVLNGDQPILGGPQPPLGAGMRALLEASLEAIVEKKGVDYAALRANDFEHWTDSLRGLLRRVLPQFDEKEVVLVGNQMIEMVNDEVKTVVERKTAQRKTRISNLHEKLGIDPQEVLDKLKELGYEIKPPVPPKKNAKNKQS